MSSVIQDGEQLTFFSRNILKTKQDINNLQYNLIYSFKRSFKWTKLIFLLPMSFNLKKESGLTRNPVLDAYWSLTLKIKKLVWRLSWRDIIQDGKQLTFFSRNILKPISYKQSVIEFKILFWEFFQMNSDYHSWLHFVCISRAFRYFLKH
jgi:hypothetical protein